jgi:Tol biopolymer transport system component
VLALALAAAAPAAQAAFPGPNGKIAFDTPLANPPIGFERELFTINPDGSGRAAVNPAPVEDTLPAWSPDGTKLVFARSDLNDQDDEIWVINADGTGATQLTDGEDDTAPAFSGDGTRIVFARNDGQPQFDNEIWVMDADGTDQLQLTSNATWDTNPVFSPDSTRIAFDREVDGTGTALFTMAADGTGQAPLTPTDGSMVAEQPDFSPDGTRLAFTRCEEVSEGCAVPQEIATMPSAGGAISEITSNAGNFDDPEDLRPAFSPDGTRIAFSRHDFNTGASDVLTVTAAGGRHRRGRLREAGQMPGLPDHHQRHVRRRRPHRHRGARRDPRAPRERRHPRARRRRPPLWRARQRPPLRRRRRRRPLRRRRL